MFEEKLIVADLDYNSYLHIDELLNLQKPLSSPPHHDEIFFIIIHQAYELWFKEILHETHLLTQALRDQSVSRALKVLKRNTAIMNLLVKQIDLLTTLTPVEFAGFRDKLKPASGFQSLQFRELEFTYGLRHEFFLKYFAEKPSYLQKLKQIQSEPSVYDEFWLALSRAGYPVSKEVLERDVKEAWVLNMELVKLIKTIYEKPEENYHWVLLFEAFLDFDQAISEWRSNHILMVARTIGGKKGTGGSSGISFLQGRLDLRLFPELWEVRTHVGTDYA